MSAYNGERFLKEQLDSVLAQKNVSVTLYVRDDGSQDATCRILSRYEGRINYLQGENLGVGNSFMTILYEAGTHYDYYAFCDQDDIWLPEKLEKAIEKLFAFKQPALYCSNQLLTDSEGSITGKRHKNPVDISYLQILCNNSVTGCTMVWNKVLQETLCRKESRPSSELLRKRIHDVWVAMVASVTGAIIYDRESYILYRQHEHNVVGVAGSTVLQEWTRKIKNPALRNGRSWLAKEISLKYADLIPDKETLCCLNVLANYRDNFAKRKALLKIAKKLCRYSGEPYWQLYVKILTNLF